MTLDEAIVHEREVAKEKRKEMQCKTCKLFARSDLHPLQGYCRKNEFRSIYIDSWSKVCSEYVPKEMCKCAEEHEQLVELLEELKEYQAIGTPEECRAAVEKQNTDEELESHDEKRILESCIALMQEMVNEFSEWYRWQHGEDAIEDLDKEERFCIRKTYFRIVQELFLIGTNHSGGTSTRAKCNQLDVDWGEEIEFDWSDEE